MKKTILFFILIATPILSMARDDVADYSVEEAMSVKEVSSAIGEGVRFYFADQTHPKVIKDLGEFKTNKNQCFCFI